jgi:hypothetical protein
MHFVKEVKFLFRLCLIIKSILLPGIGTQKYFKFPDFNYHLQFSSFLLTLPFTNTTSYLSSCFFLLLLLTCYQHWQHHLQTIFIYFLFYIFFLLSQNLKMFSVLKIIPTIHLSITLHKFFFMNISGSTNNHWLEKVYFEDTENSSRRCKTVYSLLSPK